MLDIRFIFLFLLAIVLFFCWFLGRDYRAFKKIFEVSPKTIDQFLVNLKIRKIREALEVENKKREFYKGDEDVAGYFETRLKRAIELAQKYGFTIPEEEKQKWEE